MLVRRATYNKGPFGWMAYLESFVLLCCARITGEITDFDVAVASSGNLGSPQCVSNSICKPQPHLVGHKHDSGLDDQSNSWFLAVVVKVG